MANLILLGLCFTAGIVLRRYLKLPQGTPAVLNAFIINISYPALVLLYVHRLHLRLDLLLPISAGWLFFALSFVVIRWLGKRMKWTRSTIGCMILLCGLGNTSFLGLPMIEVFFGKDGIPIGLLLDQFGSFLVLSTVGIIVASVYSGSTLDKRTIIRRIVTFPPFLSMLAALILIPLNFPPELEQVFERLGQTLAPLALVSVGFQLRVSHFREYRKSVVLGLFLKMLIFPLVLFGVYSMISGERGLLFNVMIFESAMPPMITAAIIAAEYHLEERLAAMLAAVGIIVSFLSLTGWWWVLTVL